MGLSNCMLNRTPRHFTVLRGAMTPTSRLDKFRTVRQPAAAPISDFRVPRLRWTPGVHGLAQRVFQPIIPGIARGALTSIRDRRPSGTVGRLEDAHRALRRARFFQVQLLGKEPVIPAA